MIDVNDIRARYRRTVPFLEERGRRLFAANEALATGMARSTIQCAIVELQGGSNPIGQRVRREGGGRKRAVVLQPGLPAALEALIKDAIRGDPETPLRWVSCSQRQIARVLSERGFAVSQKLVGLLLREQGYSCQANRKTLEGTKHSDCDAQGGFKWSSQHQGGGWVRWRVGDVRIGLCGRSLLRLAGLE